MRTVFLFLESSEAQRDFKVLAQTHYFNPLKAALFALIGQGLFLLGSTPKPRINGFQVYNAPVLFQSWLALRLLAFADVNL